MKLSIKWSILIDHQIIHFNYPLMVINEYSWPFFHGDYMIKKWSILSIIWPLNYPHFLPPPVDHGLRGVPLGAWLREVGPGLTAQGELEDVLTPEVRVETTTNKNG